MSDEKGATAIGCVLAVLFLLFIPACIWVAITMAYTR